MSKKTQLHYEDYIQDRQYFSHREYAKLKSFMRRLHHSNPFPCTPEEVFAACLPDGCIFARPSPAVMCVREQNMWSLIRAAEHRTVFGFENSDSTEVAFVLFHPDKNLPGTQSLIQLPEDASITPLIKAWYARAVAIEESIKEGIHGPCKLLCGGNICCVHVYNYWPAFAKAAGIYKAGKYSAATNNVIDRYIGPAREKIATLLASAEMAPDKDHMAQLYYGWV